MTWPVIALQDVCAITMGQAPAGESYNMSGTGMPLIAGAGDFKNGKLAPSKFTSSPTKRTQVNDIVLSIRASIGAKVWADGEYCLGRGVAGLRPKDELDSRFLWHWFTYAEKDLINKGKGATFPQVNRKDIGELEIPLPALVEQRKIAAILDEATNLRDRRERAVALLDNLRQSTFLAMFGRDGAELHSGKKRAIGDVISFKSGKFLPASNQSGGTYPVYGGNGINGYHSEYICEFPTIVVGRVGANCGAVHVTTPRAWVTDNALIGTTSMGAQHLTYLSDALKFANLNQYANRSGQPSITAKRIEGAPLLVPAEDQQELYARRIASIEERRLQYLHVRQASDRLLISLQSRAFRGEL